MVECIDSLFISEVLVIKNFTDTHRVEDIHILNCRLAIYKDKLIK